MGAALTKPGRVSTARWRGSGERDGKEYARNRRYYVPSMLHRLESGGYGPGAVRTRRCHDAAGNSRAVWHELPGGHGEGLRRSRGDAAGTESGSSFVERTAVNTGTVPVLPLVPRMPARLRGLGPPSADRAGAGRSRRSTPRPGEPVTWGRAAAVSRRDGGCNAERCAGEWRRPGPGARRAVGRGYRGCRPSFTVGRRPILAAGSMTCSTSCTTRRR